MPPQNRSPLFIAIGLVSAIALHCTATVRAQVVADTDWTVARITQQVEAAIERFESVRLSATYTRTRDVNAFSKREPLLLTGSGTLSYRGDQQRWFARDNGFSFRSGVAAAIPQTRISGYDGTFHYHGDLQKLTLAESQSRRSARPQGLFWEPILTYDYLIRALHRDSCKLIAAGHESGRGWVEIESAWGNDSSQWLLTVRFDTDRSFLPLWQKLQLNGKPYARSDLQQLTRIESSDDWYPAVVHTKYLQPALGTVEQKYVIDGFELVDSFGPDAFVFEPPPGADIVDRRTNLAWHSDPWWDELFPWTMQQLNFPRYRFQSLGEFRSYADPGVEGTDAPAIEAQRWIGDDPGPWQRKERKFSVVFLWGDSSSLSQPFPRWVTELAQLSRLVEAFGGEVLAIAGPNTDAEAFQKTARELMIEIPFAIDKPSGQHGATHEAFKLQHYYSVVVIDQQAKVRLVGEQEGALLAVFADILGEDDYAVLDAQIHQSDRMSRSEYNAIKAQWISLRRAANGTGRIRGSVKPAAGVTVELVPQMQMLIGSNPGGYMLFHDRQRSVSIEVDAATGQYEFDNLPKGAYRLTALDDKGESKEATLYLVPDDDQVTHDFTLP